MEEIPFSFVPLGKQDRSEFECGVEALDVYFRERVSSEVRRRVTMCYVAVENATGRIAGFYTISAADVPVGEVAEMHTRKLPRYPTIPAARLGRLAVDTRYRGLKLGSALLADAVERAESSGMGIYAMVVDAKDEEAKAFYERHGFEPYNSNPLKLLVSIKAISNPKWQSN